MPTDGWSERTAENLGPLIPRSEIFGDFAEMMSHDGEFHRARKMRGPEEKIPPEQAPVKHPSAFAEPEEPDAADKGEQFGPGGHSAGGAGPESP